VNKTAAICLCGHIRYPINAIEEPLVISCLTGSWHFLKYNSLKLYFHFKLHLLSFLLIYSLLGFIETGACTNFPQGHLWRWELTLIFIMPCIDFVSFLKVQILREFQNIEKFITFWKEKSILQTECIVTCMFPMLAQIVTHKKAGFKVTVYLQVGNVLQIWIFGSE